MTGKEKAKGRARVEEEEASGEEDESSREAGTSSISGGSSGEGITCIGNEEARAYGNREVVRSKGMEEGTLVGSEMGKEEGNQ